MSDAPLILTADEGAGWPTAVRRALFLVVQRRGDVVLRFKNKKFVIKFDGLLDAVIAGEQCDTTAE